MVTLYDTTLRDGTQREGMSLETIRKDLREVTGDAEYVNRNLAR